MNIYLAHPSNYKGKIENIKKHLRGLDSNIFVIDPFEWEASISIRDINERKYNQMVVAIDEFLIDNSDVVIAYLPELSVGVIWEICYAVHGNKPVIIISSDDILSHSMFSHKFIIKCNSYKLIDEYILHKAIELVNNHE